MPYSQQTRRSTQAIAAVVGVHLVIGYAFVSGLAYQVIDHIPIVTRASILDDPAPPPPHRLPPPPPRAADNSLRPATVTPEIVVPLNSEIAIDLSVRPDLPVAVDPGPPALPPVAPPATRPSQARGAEPGAGRAAWVTTDDYPAQALREGVSGVVGIRVTIDAAGRVTACEVTASSGNRLLDEATCRFYARRAHFRPALDAEGKAVAARYADRVRWQVPQ